ncbi:TetR/AcrR family transcriptional regulator [Nocardia sp. NPDC059246]|uniref:TetR/AcrR family transcriptional regulator n=1 Tax=unclassified Nocardia TaxID=2637762 RepID=UPI0036C9FC09
MALTAEIIAKRGSGRRAPDVVRDLVLQAADRLFSEQGYHGTKTRQIAEEAGVGESVLFRNFGSKAELFEAAILTPFTDFVGGWAKAWDVSATSASDPTEIVRSFVKGFYNLVVEHRELFQTLLAARIQGGDPALADVAARVSDKLADSVRGLQDVLLAHGAARRFRDVDAPVTVAFSVGSVMSLVLLDGWLFPASQRRPGKARQIEEATRMLLYGVTGEARSALDS